MTLLQKTPNLVVAAIAVAVLWWLLRPPVSFVDVQDTYVGKKDGVMRFT